MERCPAGPPPARPIVGTLLEQHGGWIDAASVGYMRNVELARRMLRGKVDPNAAITAAVERARELVRSAVLEQTLPETRPRWRSEWGTRSRNGRDKGGRVLTEQTCSVGRTPGTLTISARWWG